MKAERMNIKFDNFPEKEEVGYEQGEAQDIRSASQGWGRVHSFHYIRLYTFFIQYFIEFFRNNSKNKLRIHFLIHPSIRLCIQ